MKEVGWYWGDSGEGADGVEAAKGGGDVGTVDEPEVGGVGGDPGVLGVEDEVGDGKGHHYGGVQYGENDGFQLHC